MAQWLSLLQCVGILYPRASVQFLLYVTLLSGKTCAVRLVQLIPVSPVDYESGGIPVIPGVNLINESCQNTSIKGQCIQKKSPPDS